MSFKSTNYRFASERDLFAVYAILVTVSVITRKLHLYSQSRSPRRKIRFCFIDTTFFTFGRYINLSFKQFLASNQKVCRFIRFFIFFTGLTQFLTIYQKSPWLKYIYNISIFSCKSFAYRIYKTYIICLRKKIIWKKNHSNPANVPYRNWKKHVNLNNFRLWAGKKFVNS